MMWNESDKYRSSVEQASERVMQHTSSSCLWHLTRRRQWLRRQISSRCKNNQLGIYLISFLGFTELSAFRHLDHEGQTPKFPPKPIWVPFRGKIAKKGFIEQEGKALVSWWHEKIFFYVGYIRTSLVSKGVFGLRDT